MMRTHIKTRTDFKPNCTAIYRFFASQRNYGYVLSQENRYLAREIYFENSEGVSK
jgi:hypothetical protein